MAYTEEIDKQAMTMKLNNGYDASGNIKTVNSNLGNLQPSTFNLNKAMAIIEALTPCFSKGLYETAHVVTSRVVES